ncbi:hypothetical protein [Xenorhabdus kozodoii]|uniref:hypothetical protein n=1 Tax=Xenorhabdus kozodoii TaxID=351676 RepID=UPI00142E0D3A|nr:hypothetical protein [Xenorhabdus kozodoii]
MQIVRCEPRFGGWAGQRGTPASFAQSPCIMLNGLWAAGTDGLGTPWPPPPMAHLPPPAPMPPGSPATVCPCTDPSKLNGDYRIFCQLKSFFPLPSSPQHFLTWDNGSYPMLAVL